MFETEIGLVFNNALAGVVVNKREDGENNGELGDTDASVAESINNVPGVAKPGDFGKNEATD